MAISFSCPSCKAHVQVGDELAGQTGQCPRCERLLIIPSSAQPRAILLDAEGNPVPILVPVPTPREEPKARSSRYDEPRRSRRKTPVEKKPAGPMWPWALGVLGGLAVVGLLLSSFIALCAHRPPAPSANVQFVEMKPAKQTGVLVGKLEGNRVTMQDGVFQVRAALTPDDPVHLNGRRYKAYKVELRGRGLYQIEVDGAQFPVAIRLEDAAGVHILENRAPINGNITIFHVPQFTNIFTVVVTSVNPAFGEFTLTIREANRQKPPVR